MRQLKLATETKYFELCNVPENFKFVEKIAKQYSKTKEEMEHYYSIGVKAIENFNLEFSESNNQKKILWTVRQAILADQTGKHSS